MNIISFVQFNPIIVVVWAFNDPINQITVTFSKILWRFYRVMGWPNFPGLKIIFKPRAWHILRTEIVYVIIEINRIFGFSIKSMVYRCRRWCNIYYSFGMNVSTTLLSELVNNSIKRVMLNSKMKLSAFVDDFNISRNLLLWIESTLFSIRSTLPFTSSSLFDSSTFWMLLWISMILIESCSYLPSIDINFNQYSEVFFTIKFTYFEDDNILKINHCGYWQIIVLNSKKKEIQL